MPLRSQLFAGESKLEAAHAGDAAHITPGAIGEHVRKIQLALNLLDSAGLVADGVYGARTSAAVLRYKNARNIVNKDYQSQADNIVGALGIQATARRSRRSIPRHRQTDHFNRGTWSC
jgi:peptidoglycan hydrolase-like protein with peptidoglycan-binding domain